MSETIEDNIQVLFKSAPEGLPTEDNFEIKRAPMPSIGEGQFLLRNLYLSLDPYQRMLMGGGWTYSGGDLKPGDLMVGRILGEVIESKNPDYPIGTYCVGRLGWQTHAVSDGSNLDFTIPRDSKIPLSAYMGAAGSTGVTAWVGLKVTGQMKPSDTVLISAAAGSVGSAAGQIAKAFGCNVIGIAGGPVKCKIVTDVFGFDACVDYKAPDLTGQIKAAAPEGVDLYFDNVGGDVLSAALANMNKGGRIPLCGVLAAYNVEGEAPKVANMGKIFDKSLRIEGFVQTQYKDHWDEARAELIDLIQSGKLAYRETIADGIDAAPSAFIGMLQGANVGKQLVQLA